MQARVPGRLVAGQNRVRGVVVVTKSTTRCRALRVTASRLLVSRANPCVSLCLPVSVCLKWVRVPEMGPCA